MNTRPLIAACVTLLVAACTEAGSPSQPGPSGGDENVAFVSRSSTSSVFYIGPSDLSLHVAEIETGGKIGAKWTRVEIPAGAISSDTASLDLASRPIPNRTCRQMVPY
jgi:hypothetical protein